MPEPPFDEAALLRRAAMFGISFDTAQLASVTRQLRGPLEALAAFDLRAYKFSEPSNTFDARWK